MKIVVISWLTAGILALCNTACCQIPTAGQLAWQMTIGINLGNTLEAICDEGAWGAGKTPKQLIDSIKAAGFNTIRLPVAWFCHADTITLKIDRAWKGRVKEVVDYCISNNMYAIINMHWDKGWLENRIDAKNQQQVHKRLHKYWTQIATFFKSDDEQVL
ncbi:MAG TPA: cellulase family glycosylhydrolase, partial [Phnomibacter sp.]|nr:cellulase family glycosylhydrolase [Phnomibacter sp.]